VVEKYSLREGSQWYGTMPTQANIYFFNAKSQYNELKLFFFFVTKKNELKLFPN